MVILVVNPKAVQKADPYTYQNLEKLLVCPLQAITEALEVRQDPAVSIIFFVAEDRRNVRHEFAEGPKSVRFSLVRVSGLGALGGDDLIDGYKEIGPSLAVDMIRMEDGVEEQNSEHGCGNIERASHRR